MSSSDGHSTNKVSAGALLVTLGIIFGDIGTSPLYVFKSIVGTREITESLVLGGLSCVFWTLTLQTTLKYVLLTLRADNNGEGGIFSLYTLVRAHRPGLTVVAMIGGSMLLADGIITPPITVTSAIEGLDKLRADIPVVPIVILVIIAIFVMQSFGTSMIGKFFGPIMLGWFGMLAAVGIYNLGGSWSIVLEAINPVNAYKLLMEYPAGFGLLGFVFLCTTGAEALYSDLGHCGRKNIQITWFFVKICLLLNYFGQGAWLLNQDNKFLGKANPFFAMMPEGFLVFGIVMATLAAIVASQALISGSYTLVSEAMRLNLWPKVEIVYPTNIRGQIYIPSINWLLLLGCIGVVLYFQKSEHMEAAYGLAITVTMLMTTILLLAYFHAKGWNPFLLTLFGLLFLAIEGCFLVSNLAKFMHGGYVSLVLAGFIWYVMHMWLNVHLLKKELTEMENIERYVPHIERLSDDKAIPKLTENLVYLTSSDSPQMVEMRILESIFDHHPKRADMYWFVHVDTDNQPHTEEYSVHRFPNAKNMIRLTFKLGFRVDMRIDYYMRNIIADLVKTNEIEITPAAQGYEEVVLETRTGDIQFIVMRRSVSHDSLLSGYQDFLLNWFYRVKKLTISEDEWFGIDPNNIKIEDAPLVINPYETRKLVRRDH